MLKKISFLFSFTLLSILMTAQQDSVRIEKAVLLFYDSSENAPVVRKIPAYEAIEFTLDLKYKNYGNLDIVNHSLQLETSHRSYPLGGSGVGLVHKTVISLDTIKAGISINLRQKISEYSICYFGTHDIKFSIEDSSGNVLDSSIFYFEVLDSTYSKSAVTVSSESTGPGLFSDSTLNQFGGFVQGDRFGTLYELNGVYLAAVPLPMPLSLSFYISNDSSNIGAEIVPKIWRTSIDTFTNEVIIGHEIASANLPFTVDSANLGQLITLEVRQGTTRYNSYSPGYYIAGFESTLANPNGKSLKIGRDTVGEKLQSKPSSFVYFGHDTNWYSTSHLPLIGLNFDRGYFNTNQPIRGCLPVGIDNELRNKSQFKIHPNPSNGSFTLEHSASIQTFEVYNVNGQKVQVELFNSQLDLTDQHKGIYLLRVLLESGELVSKKLIKY